MLAPSRLFSEGNRLFTEFKGALSENYVLQALQPQFEAVPRRVGSEPVPLVSDFPYPAENDVFPVEEIRKIPWSRSLRAFKERFSDRVRPLIRFSLEKPETGRRSLEHSVVHGRSCGSTDRVGLEVKRMRSAGMPPLIIPVVALWAVRYNRSRRGTHALSVQGPVSSAAPCVTYFLHQKAVLDLIENLPDSVDEVWVFGSSVSLKCGQDSDLDVCLSGSLEMADTKDLWVYLNYNTGRRISANGRSLANTLDDLISVILKLPVLI